MLIKYRVYQKKVNSLKISLNLKVLEVTMNMHEVRGWDLSLERKTQLKVTHTPELTSDPHVDSS